MQPKGKPAFYAVRIGRKPGVYTTWPEAQSYIAGFPGAIHKKFPTRSEAEAFARPGGAESSPRVSSTRIRSREEEGEDGPPPLKRRKRDASEVAEGTRTVYCDGSSLGNGKVGSKAGIGIFWSHEMRAMNVAERLPGKQQTNNRAEMYAVARILEMDPTPHLPLTICTDSQYTISVFSEWIPAWRRRGWRTATNTAVVNKDLILYVLALISLRMPANAYSPTANVSFHKVKAHIGIEGNEQADRFAKEGAVMAEVAERDYEREVREIEKKLRERGAKKVELQFVVECEDGDLLSEEEMRRMEELQEFD